jgi:hypothetical protein
VHRHSARAPSYIEHHLQASDVVLELRDARLVLDAAAPRRGALCRLAALALGARLRLGKRCARVLLVRLLPQGGALARQLPRKLRRVARPCVCLAHSAILAVAVIVFYAAITNVIIVVVAAAAAAMLLCTDRAEDSEAAAQLGHTALEHVDALLGVHRALFGHTYELRTSVRLIDGEVARIVEVALQHELGVLAARGAHVSAPAIAHARNACGTSPRPTRAARPSRPRRDRAARAAH